jgi:hypothetical protein
VKVLLPVVVAGALAVATAADAGDRVRIAAVRAQPCTRAGIATGVMAHFGLMNERRFAALRDLWLPKSRYAFYAYVLFVTANGETLRTKLGADLPRLAEGWAATDKAEVVGIDPRVDAKDSRRSAFAATWLRRNDDGSAVVVGTGKGLWDCEQHRLGRLVGGERTASSEEAARAEGAADCGRRGSTMFRRFGQVAALCRLPR